MKKTALSGIQTSGNLHLGNYLGAIKNWLTMQEQYDCYFFHADLHSLTSNIDPKILRNSIYESVATYLASGLDPNKSVIFLQSHVKEHTEFSWILNSITPIGWLKRMTQFKDKAGKKQDLANSGLFIYPVLMAADILLYNTDIVPVGEDQKQHLEFTRDIAGLLNRSVGQEICRMPEPIIKGPATRVMGLKDGTKKMSKSNMSDSSRINLLDTPEDILKKFKKAKTDSDDNFSYDKQNRPELTNLLNIYSSFSGESTDSIIERYQGKGFALFKKSLAELTIQNLTPIQDEYAKIIKDKSYMMSIMKNGAEKASLRAVETMNKVKDAIGLV